ncbi:MAG: MnhB domain-containing protein [Opitutales bacterium]
MKSFVLIYAGRAFFPFLVLLSLVVLYRGHNLPGGGFIGGLLGAMPFIFIGLGEGMDRAHRMLPVKPVLLLGCGLGLAFLSGLPGLFKAPAFLVGQWLPGMHLPLLGEVHLGTPLVFDVGVYLTVIGFVLHTTFSLVRLGHLEDNV